MSKDNPLMPRTPWVRISWLAIARNRELADTATSNLKLPDGTAIDKALIDALRQDIHFLLSINLG